MPRELMSFKTESYSLYFDYFREGGDIARLLKDR